LTIQTEPTISEPFKLNQNPGTMLTRLYLRASTNEQDADRARATLEQFGAENGLTVAATYAENESGAKLDRPALFRLLADSKPGDVLLCEQVDRLSRLTDADWKRLRVEIDRKQVRIVALDLPTSWVLLRAGKDDFTDRMLSAINSMMLDMLAAISRKDYEDRRRRQAEGQARAKTDGKYRGRPEDEKRNAGIAAMLAAGISWSAIQNATGCGRATVAKIAARLRSAG
jgi:DNA invertase Pin-like site-specific DNA recombinase